MVTALDFCFSHADKSAGDLDIGVRQSMPVTSEKPSAGAARKSTSTIVAVTLSGKALARSVLLIAMITHKYLCLTRRWRIWTFTRFHRALKYTFQIFMEYLLYISHQFHTALPPPRPSFVRLNASRLACFRAVQRAVRVRAATVAATARGAQVALFGVQ